MAIRKAGEPAQPAPATDAVADAAAALAAAGSQMMTAPAVAAPAPETPATAAVPALVNDVATVATAAAPIAAIEFAAQHKMEKVMKTAEEMMTFGQGNVEAFVKAGQIWTSGVQEMTKQLAATAQAQVDSTVAAFKALSGVKSLKEAMDLQAAHARASMEKAMSETGKLTDASLKLTEQTLAPITARVTLAMEKFGRAA